jgi:LysR family transcriptional regulator, low CO2-responsive transcriptional regulator
MNELASLEIFGGRKILPALLSVAELTIIRGVASGKTQAEIGEDVHLEQSTISKTIKGIEERVGFDIVTVIGRRLQLSQAGLELAVAAERVLAAFDDLDGFAKELKAGRAGSVRFITSSTPGSYVLPRIVAEYVRTFEHVSVDMEIVPISGLRRTFNSDRFDFAIGPSMGMPPGLLSDHLYSDPVVFFTTPGAQIATRSSVTLADLANETLVGKFVDSHWRRIFRELEDRGFRAQRKVTIIPPEGVKAMVAQGLGVGVLFESSIRTELDEGSLVRLPLAAPPLQETFCLARSRYEELSPAAAGFVQFLRAHLTYDSAEYDSRQSEL